jgi:dimethylamine monooxygenase subunit A
MAAGADFDPVSTIDGKPHRTTLGLRRLDPAHWLLVDEHADAEIEHKRELLAAHADEVLCTSDTDDEAAGELLTLIQETLAAHHCDRLRPVDPRIHPLRSAALLVQEDLCLLSRGPSGWTLTSACVCFPSRWRLSDKVGRSVCAIHDPVPEYDRIATPVDTFLDRLSPDRPMWRTNWTLMDDPELFQPTRTDTDVSDPGSWTFRVERQTLRLLPRSGAAVFTIRTYRRTLAQIADRDPAAAADLATTLATVPQEQADYRSWDDVPALMTWLYERADRQ